MDTYAPGPALRLERNLRRAAKQRMPNKSHNLGPQAGTAQPLATKHMYKQRGRHGRGQWSHSGSGVLSKTFSIPADRPSLQRPSLRLGAAPRASSGQPQSPPQFSIQNRRVLCHFIGLMRLIPCQGGGITAGRPNYSLNRKTRGCMQTLRETVGDFCGNENCQDPFCNQTCYNQCLIELGFGLCYFYSTAEGRSMSIAASRQSPSHEQSPGSKLVGWLLGAEPK